MSIKAKTDAEVAADLAQQFHEEENDYQFAVRLSANRNAAVISAPPTIVVLGSVESKDAQAQAQPQPQPDIKDDSEAASLALARKLVAEDKAHNKLMSSYGIYSAKYACNVCLEDKKPGTGVKLPCGKHFMCFECIIYYANVRVPQRQLLMCPAGCKNVIIPTSLIALACPASIANKYFENEQLGIKSHGMFHCRTVNCKNAVIVVGNEYNSCFRCEQCKKAWCVKCGKPWHQSITCLEYKVR